jgi:hypothetical protein
VVYDEEREGAGAKRADDPGDQFQAVVAVGVAFEDGAVAGLDEGRGGHELVLAGSDWFGEGGWLWGGGACCPFGQG